MRRDILAAVLATLLMAMPTALSAWSAKGGYEPDTKIDRAAGFNFEDPDWVPTTNATKVHKVYFSGFLGNCDTNCYAINPNVASVAGVPVRSAFDQDQTIHVGILGVWKDCNHDGFVGLGDQGLWEYRSELLASTYGTSICGVEPLPATPDPVRGYGIIHNDGQWVREMISIQWRYWLLDRNVFNINDNGSRMWYDDRTPGEDPGVDPGNCWLSPQPTGTWHNAGGMVRWVDCLDGYRGTDLFDSQGDHLGGTCVSNPPVTQCAPRVSETGLDELGLGQVTFSDAPRAQHTSTSRLNVKPWGEESDGAYVQAWDCSRPTHGVDVGTAHVINYSDPRVPPGVSTTGSPSGTANATGSGFDECRRPTENNGERHYGRTAGRLPYSTEGAVAQAGGAKSSTNTMAPRERNRPNPPWALLAKQTPEDFGVHYSTDDFWSDGADNIHTPGVTYVTFYAVVSQTAVTTYGLTLPGMTGTYGAEACGASRTGEIHNWQCDPTLWWKDATGRDIEPRSVNTLGPGPDGTGYPIGARIGYAYNLRDVDCVDMSITGLRERGINGDTVPAAIRGTGLVGGLSDYIGSGPQRTCDMTP